jgi:hypothetical protein
MQRQDFLPGGSGYSLNLFDKAQKHISKVVSKIHPKAVAVFG